MSTRHLVQLASSFVLAVGLVWLPAPAGATVQTMGGPPCVSTASITLHSTNPNVARGAHGNSGSGSLACVDYSARTTANLYGSYVSGSTGWCNNASPSSGCIAQGSDAYGNPHAVSGVRKSSTSVYYGWAVGY